MTFLQAGLLFAVICFFLFLVADRLAVLASEVKQMRALIIEMVAGAPKQLVSHEDPIVHDSHSEGDEYESVTKRAERAWG